MGQNALCKDLAELYAFLIEAVDVPDKALEHDLVLEVCKKGTQRLRGELLADDDARRTAALEVLVRVLIVLAAGEGDDLSGDICAQLLLAG